MADIAEGSVTSVRIRGRAGRLNNPRRWARCGCAAASLLPYEYFFNLHTKERKEETNNRN